MSDYRPIKKLVVPIGKYVKDGIEKTEWLTTGIILSNGHKTFVKRKAVVPPWVDWDGTEQVFAWEERDQQPQQPAQQQGGFQDDVPF